MPFWPAHVPCAAQRVLESSIKDFHATWVGDWHAYGCVLASHAVMGPLKRWVCICRSKQGVGDGDRIWQLYWIPDNMGQWWSAWICTSSWGGAVLSSPIGAAVVLPKVRGKISSCLRLVQQQHPETCAGCNAGTPDCLFQLKLGLHYKAAILCTISW